MESGFFDRFFDSLAHLERALGSTRSVLEEKGVLSNSVEARFESYNSILEKQKNLASELPYHFKLRVSAACQTLRSSSVHVSSCAVQN